MRRQVYVIVCMSVLVGAIFCWFGFGKAQQKNDSAAELEKVTVAATLSAGMMKPSELLLNGNVEGSSSTAISSKYNGKVQHILVEDGQRVVQGETLVILDNVETANALRVSENTVRESEANYHDALTKYNRLQSLYVSAAIARQEVDSAETTLKVMEVKLQNNRISYESDCKQLADTYIAAPVSGFVVNKTVTDGQVISPGNVLMTVEDINNVYVVINVEQKEIGLIKQGMDAAIHVDSYADKVFPGKIAIINPAAASNRLFRVKIKVDNSEHLLKSGMFVQVVIKTGEDKQVLVVPRKAVLQKKGMNYVFIVENDQARQVRVQSGKLIGEYMEIIQGITDNVPVITSNLDTLKDGDKVVISE